MSDVYSISIKNHISRMTRLINENVKCYESLKDKDTLYARQVKALQHLHGEVYLIYKNAPNKID